MLFFYKSHNHLISEKGHRNNFSNAEKYAIPTQLFNTVVHWKKYRNNKKAIGVTDFNARKKRAVSSTSFSGSLTVEAALVLPVFLSVILLLSGLFHALSVCSQVNHYLCMTGRKIAAYSQTSDTVTTKEVCTLFYAHLKESGIDASRIGGGYAGLVPQLEILDSGTCIKVSVDYWIKFPGYMMPTKKLRDEEVVYVRPWTGATLSEYEALNGAGQSEMVYIAENGSVYHEDAMCSYLDLSVHACMLANVHQLRNQSGARYIPCERCGQAGNAQMTVYITDDGRAWHTDRMCSGLKRTVGKMHQDEAEHKGLKPCSRCGRHGG